MNILIQLLCSLFFYEKYVQYGALGFSFFFFDAYCIRMARLLAARYESFRTLERVRIQSNCLIEVCSTSFATDEDMHELCHVHWSNLFDQLSSIACLTTFDYRILLILKLSLKSPWQSIKGSYSTMHRYVISRRFKNQKLTSSHLCFLSLLCLQYRSFACLATLFASKAHIPQGSSVWDSPNLNQNWAWLELYLRKAKLANRPSTVCVGPGTGLSAHRLWC